MTPPNDPPTSFDHEYLRHPGLRSVKANATPTPGDLYLGYSRSGYTFEDATAEFVDNALRQAFRTGRPDQVIVKVSSGHDGKDFVIRIEDNAGGCPKDSATRFITPGATSVGAGDDGISRFGIGSKAGGLSISKRVVIQSWCAGDRGFVAVLDKEQVLRKRDWDFDILDLPASGHVQMGGTWVDLVGVDSRADAAVRNSFAARFGERYAYLLGKGSPKLLVNGVEVKPADPLRKLLSTTEAPSGCGPRSFSVAKQYGLSIGGKTERKEVTFNLTVGLGMQIDTTRESGARVYCNGRLVGQPVDIKLNFTDEDESKTHPSSMEAWLRAVIDIRGPAELMPWTYSKNALDPFSPTYNDLVELLRKGCTTFVDENVAEARRGYRHRNPKGKGLPSVHDTMMLSYEDKIRGKEMDVSKVRQEVASSDAFIKAIPRSKSEKPIGPTTNEEKGVVCLKDDIPRADAERVKALVESATGVDDPSGAEIVRVLVRHYIDCVGGKTHAPG